MKRFQLRSFAGFILFFCLCTSGFSQNVWRFAVLGDTHVGSSDTLAEMIPYLLNDSIDCILFPGDIAEGGLAASGIKLTSQLNRWKEILAPIYAEGIEVYAIRGNHENDAHNNISAWNNFFSGVNSFPANGPDGETNLTYSFNHKNALFIALDNYINIHTLNQSWLNNQLSQNTIPNVFVFGHEPAFKVFHTDCLDDSTTQRNIFWQSLSKYGVKVYFCGHDHFVDAARVDDGDGNPENDVIQYIVGTGGGWLMPQYSNYNGINSHYYPKRIFHDTEHGYALVEVNGDGPEDCEITITWKKRHFNPATSAIEYIPTSNVIKYSNCDGISSNTMQTAEYPVISPNPCIDFCKVSLIKEYKDIKIDIYDKLGNYIKEFRFTYSNSGSLDLTNFPQGIFIMKITLDGIPSLLKFMKI
jgi:hypothetical protein